MSFSGSLMRRDYGYNVAMVKISREQAIQMGLKRYFTGRPCSRGHIAERFASTFSCVVCQLQHSANRRVTDDSRAKRLQKDRENREVIRDRRRAYDAENRSHINARAMEWCALNKAKVSEASKKYRKKKMDDPRYVLSKRMSDRLRFSLRSGKNGASWRNLVGFDVNELANHLQNQFEPGMTWDNMGEWHIDHIVPIVEFNFSSPYDDDFKACWSLWNLRPIWSRQNLSKGGKRLFLL